MIKAVSCLSKLNYNSTMVEDDDEDYFAEVDPDAELTGFEAKFVKIPGMETLPKELMEMTVDKLVPMYIACRNQLATDTKGYKARKESVKGFMGLISMALREKADLVGTDTFKGDYGTAFRQTKEKFTIGDWPEFVKWLEKTGNFHTLQKRVSPNAVKDVREADGSLPPGVTVFTEVEFAVRSPTAKRK
jgi:hypothetical protein